MSDEELCKALRSALWGQGHHINIKAADRIEELLTKNAGLFDLAAAEHTRAEGLSYKLAKAMEALRKLDRRNDSLDTFNSAVHEIVSTVLAELEGKE